MGDFNSWDRRDFLSAVEDWRCGTMTELEVVRFKEILRNNLHACQVFVEYGDLLTELSLEIPRRTSSMDAVVAGALDAVPRSSPGARWMAFASGLLLASVGAIFIAAMFWISPQPRAVAAVRNIHSLHSQPEGAGLTLNNVTPETFTAGTFLRENDELVLKENHLFVTVEFVSGASLLLQGPATLVFKTENSAELKSGRALGTIPRSAVGFTLFVPSGLVRDLGTEFVVDASKSQTQVFVQAGEVECELKSFPGTAAKTTLRQGESVRIDAETNALQQMPISPATFREIVEFHAGIVGMTGALQFSSEPVPLEQDPRSFHSEAAIVSLEREAVPVKWFPATSEIGLGGPVREELGDSSLGTKVRLDHVSLPFLSESPDSFSVDSYFVRLKTKSTMIDVTGAMTFRYPVIGILSSSEGLMATDEFLATPEFAAEWKRLAGRTRGIEEPGELVEISPDGRTVRFKLHTTGTGGCDEMRVFVCRPENIGR